MSLKDEILASGLPLSDHGAIATFLSQNRTVLGEVSKEDFTLWAASTGMRAKIEDHAENTDSPLRSIALACRDVIRGATVGINFSKPVNINMLTSWVQAGELTQADADALLALATKPQIITSQDVTKALE